ncbi:AMIN-like domain-containing (lipo)protein [Xylanimonas sp. McL0601]|uniref:AMIN-like domain-containing (lipo)protein n=1 Tax=Xylanimonas sp. McL0601 TaxID=3414739 RepID=UPI003CF778B4
MRRRVLVWISVLSLLFTGTVLAGSVLAAPPAAAHPYCGQVWGSLAKGAPGMTAGQLTGIRAGRHTCYDRLVLDINRPLTGWSVRYVSQVTADGSGNVVPVNGGARLEVIVRVGIPTNAFRVGIGGTLVNTTGYRTFRDVAWAGSFEGVTTIGLGVRARLPFRAFVLPGPGAGSRLVVDVGHQWCATGHTDC